MNNTRTPSETYAIVLAKATMDGVRLTGRYKDRLQQEAETEAAPLAKACTWAYGYPSDEDHKKAQAYAAADGWTVFTFTRTEWDKDPLAVARAKVMP